MSEGLVFNIQRYSIHDGEGIRTIIFFKGCPLRCPWCSNPESQNTNREIMRKESLCIKCVADSIFTCDKTPEFCPTNALEWIGREMTIDELVEEVKKDLIFYNSSGGGVTLSGGEILSQGKFALELLKRLKSLGIHTAIETTGHGNWELLNAMSDYLDEILFDFKIMDNEKFEEVIKGNSQLIKENFTKLVKKGAPVIPRIPLIPKFTMDKENISNIITFLQENQMKKVHLLPFHQYGSSKYKSIDKEYTLQNLPISSKEEIRKIKNLFEENGFEVTIGG